MISSAPAIVARAASIAASALFTTTITPAAACPPPGVKVSQCSCLYSASGRHREPARLMYFWGSPTSEMGSIADYQARCGPQERGRSRGHSDARLDVVPERGEIDRLGEQRLS